MILFIILFLLAIFTGVFLALIYTGDMGDGFDEGNKIMLLGSALEFFAAIICLIKIIGFLT